MYDQASRIGKVNGIWVVEIVVPKWMVLDIMRDCGMKSLPPPTLRIKSQLNYGCSRRIGDEIPEDPFDGYAEFTFSLVPHTDEQPTP